MTAGNAAAHFAAKGVDPNRPARISFICGLLAAYLACANRAGYQTKAVVALSLVALATAIIGLHISGQPAASKRGRVPAFLGLTLAVIALLSAPLPPSSPCATRRADFVVTTPQTPPEPKPAPERSHAAPQGQPKALPAAKPADPVDDEQEEGF